MRRTSGRSPSWSWRSAMPASTCGHGGGAAEAAEVSSGVSEVGKSGCWPTAWRHCLGGFTVGWSWNLWPLEFWARRCRRRAPLVMPFRRACPTHCCKFTPVCWCVPRGPACWLGSWVNFRPTRNNTSHRNSLQYFPPTWCHCLGWREDLDHIKWLKSATSLFWSKMISSNFPVIYHTLLDWNWDWLQYRYKFVTYYDVPEYFEHLYLERFLKIIWQYHLCWAILNFNFPFIYSVLEKNLVFIYPNFPVQELILLFSILIVIWLYWYTILIIIPYPWSYKKLLTIDFREDIHSYQLVPPPWSFLYFTSSLTLFRATLNIPRRCHL